MFFWKTKFRNVQRPGPRQPFPRFWWLSTSLPRPRTSESRMSPACTGAFTFIFRISAMTSKMRAFGTGRVRRNAAQGHGAAFHQNGGSDGTDGMADFLLHVFRAFEAFVSADEEISFSLYETLISQPLGQRMQVKVLFIAGHPPLCQSQRTVSKPAGRGAPSRPEEAADIFSSEYSSCPARPPRNRRAWVFWGGRRALHPVFPVIFCGTV